MKKLITLVTLFALLACVALPAIAETNTAEPIVVTMAMTSNRPLDCWTDCNDFVKLKEDHNITVDWQFYDDDKLRCFGWRQPAGRGTASSGELLRSSKTGWR